MVELKFRKYAYQADGAEASEPVVRVPVAAALDSTVKDGSSSEPEDSEPEGPYGLKKWKLQDWVPFNIMPFHIWNRLNLSVGHVCAVYAIYLALSGQTPNPWEGFVVLVFYGYLGGIGTTAGAHRLWTHKCYKANKPLQWMLMLFQSMTFQYPLIKWCRDHRIHHKYTDTNADPHSAARGFWFSHLGWVIMKEHPDVLKKEKTIPMDDLENNPILDFQARHYNKLLFLTNFAIPWTILAIFFSQPFFHIICINYLRWIAQLHFSCMVNSVAHIWGNKPYDKSTSSVENKILSIFTIGEAWHNYHHAFPYDYKTSELPFYTWNVTTAFIDFFGWLGWATELKTVPPRLVEDRAKRTGDGSWKKQGGHEETEEEDEEIRPAIIDGKVATWGWGDTDMGAKEVQKVRDHFRLAKFPS